MVVVQPLVMKAEAIMMAMEWRMARDAV